MIEWISENLGVITTLGSIIGVPTLIEWAPIKISPWSVLFGWIGKKMTAGTDEKIATLQNKIDTLDTKFTAFETENKEDKADQARGRILRFSDEVRRGESHSKEHWDSHMEDIDKYEDYCDSHPGYKNSKAVAAISISKELYAERLKKNDFLE